MIVFVIANISFGLGEFWLSFVIILNEAFVVSVTVTVNRNLDFSLTNVFVLVFFNKKDASSFGTAHVVYFFYIVLTANEHCMQP